MQTDVFKWEIRCVVPLLAASSNLSGASYEHDRPAAGTARPSLGSGATSPSDKPFPLSSFLSPRLSSVSFESASSRAQHLLCCHFILVTNAYVTSQSLRMGERLGA